jgi:hypothetical protein
MVAGVSLAFSSVEKNFVAVNCLLKAGSSHVDDGGVGSPKVLVWFCKGVWDILSGIIG